MMQEQPPTQEDTASSDEMYYWQQRLVRGALRATVVFGLFMLAGAIYSGYERGNYWVIPIYLGTYLVTVAIAYWPNAPYRLQVVIILLLLYVLAVVVFITRGLGDSSRIYLLTILFVVGMFLGRKEGIYAFLSVFGTMALFAWLFVGGYITDYDEVVSTDPASWFNLTFELLGMGAFILVSLNYLVPQIRDSLARSRELTRELEQIQTGLEAQVAERTRNAELARQEAEQARRSLERQLEFVRAQTELNDILRNAQGIDNLANDALSYLCHYLNAPVGAIYLLQDGVFRRVGQFAIPADFEHGTRFKPGEGLVGQAALEKRPLVVREIPADALRVNSGLGQAAPVVILAVPLIFGAEVVGVLEFGLLDDADLEHQMQFLEKVTEGIAIAFNVIKDRLRIENLLAETQSQAERLRSQEEELRVANEEFRAQSDMRGTGSEA